MNHTASIVTCAIIASLALSPGASAGDDRAAENPCVKEFLKDQDVGGALGCLGSGQCKDTTQTPGPHWGVNGDCRLVYTDAEMLCIGRYADEDHDHGLYLHRHYECDSGSGGDLHLPAAQAAGGDRTALPCWIDFTLLPPWAVFGCTGVFECAVEADPAVPSASYECAVHCPVATEGNPQVTPECRIVYTDYATQMLCEGEWQDTRAGPVTYRRWQCTEVEAGVLS